MGAEVVSRAELEQVVREQIERAVSNALTAGVPSLGMLRRAAGTIMDAADEWKGTS